MNSSEYLPEAAWRISLVALLCCAAGAGTWAQDDEPRFITEQASGVVDAEGYTRVEILGLVGAVNVRAGRPGGDLAHLNHSAIGLPSRHARCN